MVPVPKGSAVKGFTRHAYPKRHNLNVEVCPMPITDDRETEQIGKLIDAGYPELAASTFRSRWRYRLLTRVAVILIPLGGAVALHMRL